MAAKFITPKAPDAPERYNPIMNLKGMEVDQVVILTKDYDAPCIKKEKTGKVGDYIQFMTYVIYEGQKYTLFMDGASVEIVAQALNKANIGGQVRVTKKVKKGAKGYFETYEAEVLTSSHISAPSMSSQQQQIPFPSPVTINHQTLTDTEAQFFEAIWESRSAAGEDNHWELCKNSGLYFEELAKGTNITQDLKRIVQLYPLFQAYVIAKEQSQEIADAKQ